MKKQEKNLRMKGGKWRVDYRVPAGRDEKTGKPKYRRCREAFDSRDEAMEVLDQVRAKRRTSRRMQKLGVAVPVVDSGLVTFEELAKKVIARHSSTKRRKTAISHQTCLNALLSSGLFAGRRLLDITPETITAYMAERRASKPIAANRELSFLKLAFKKALDWGEASVNPAAPVSKGREPETRIRVLSDEEAGGLLAAAPSHLKPILEVLLSTAMRKSEALSARWEFPGWDAEPRLKNTIISLEKRLIHIPGEVAKNHKSRIIPMNARLVELFKGLRKTNARDSVFGVKDIPKSFRSTAKTAGLTGLRIHHLRHTAISRWIEDGVDVVTVCELAGHSDLKITLRYCHSDAERKLAAIKKRSAALARARKRAEARKPVRSGQKVDVIQQPARVSDYGYYN